MLRVLQWGDQQRGERERRAADEADADEIQAEIQAEIGADFGARPTLDGAAGLATGGKRSGAT